MKGLLEYMGEKYDNREDKDNMFGVGITDREFVAYSIEYLLGRDWFVVDPLGRNLINEIALYEILERYSKRFRKEKERKKRTVNRHD